MIRISWSELWEFASTEISIAGVIWTNTLRYHLVQDSLDFLSALVDHLFWEQGQLLWSVPCCIELIFPGSCCPYGKFVHVMTILSHDVFEHIVHSVLFCWREKGGKSLCPGNQAYIFADIIRQFVCRPNLDDSDVLTFNNFSFVGVQICKKSWCSGNVVTWDVDIAADGGGFEVVWGSCASKSHIA